MSLSSSPPVDDIAEAHAPGGFQAITIALCAFVIVLDGFDTQSIGFLVPYISKTLAVPVNAFGPVLAAGLAGLMIGAMMSGPLADAFGRKWTVIVSVVAFGLFAMATARANSYSELVALRFLTGLGLGGALPNAMALGAESAPKWALRLTVAVLTAGMPFGAFVAGLASGVILPRWGWQAVLYVGGSVPLILALVLVGQLPESAKFLTERNHEPIARGDDGFPVLRLFSQKRAGYTLLLWTLFFTSLLTIYFIVSWLPALLLQSGMPASAGVTAISLFSIAGVIGTLIEGPLVNRSGALAILLVQFILCAALVASLAFSAGAFAPTMAIVFALGALIQGVQAGLNSLAADFYPTAMRSTGLGCALGMGRIGSIVGPLVAGLLLTLSWAPKQIFLAGSIPAAVAALALAISLPFKRSGL